MSRVPRKVARLIESLQYLHSFLGLFDLLRVEVWVVLMKGSKSNVVEVSPVKL